MSGGNFLLAQDPKSLQLFCFQKVKWHIHLDSYLHSCDAFLLKGHLPPRAAQLPGQNIKTFPKNSSVEERTTKKYPWSLSNVQS